jgi:hypothetical protein
MKALMAFGALLILTGTGSKVTVGSFSRFGY